MAAKPLKHLHLLDDLQHRYSAVLDHFGKMLTVLQREGNPLPHDTRGPELLMSLIQGFLAEAPRTSYEDLRKAVLTFCLHEFIAPHQVAEVIDQYFSLNQYLYVSHHLAADWPLHYVYLAHQLFWNCACP
jgi:hypothetical protein